MDEISNEIPAWRQMRHIAIAPRKILNSVRLVFTSLHGFKNSPLQETLIVYMTK